MGQSRFRQGVERIKVEPLRKLITESVIPFPCEFCSTRALNRKFSKQLMNK